ncbi:MAG: bifunctional folylpolyglutamate synthase/dihydrofolate synthase [Phycisphaerales bacterium]|nr:bifunctional folylpolyglutamate synthase/dihydrofolate synthase [Phycisphaerales bacterium]
MRLIRVNSTAFKLDRVRTLLEQLGNPHESVQTVHVAGTVGKGSTVAMIGSILEGCGYTVGQFTSPHVTDVRERMAINGRPIERSDFVELMRQVKAASERAQIEPTYFEILTAAAFRYFADQAVDLAVIETGLGGRLDCTNVITPLVTVITRIDYDHMQILGSTLAEIATEKAGIFKPGVPAITIEQPEGVEDVLRAEAARIGAPISVINREIEYSCRFGATQDLGPHTRVCVITPTSQFMHVPVPLPGEHMAGNCALALAAVDLLKGMGFKIAEVPLHEGLVRTKTPGRMELIAHRPRILVDGAHNPASIGAVMRSVGAHVPYDSMVCIFGCCEDKDIASMLDMVALGGDKIIFTRAKSTARAADPEDLQRLFTERNGKMSQVAQTLDDALDLARRAVSREDLIFITGSFYLIGEAKKAVHQYETAAAAAAAAR